MVGAVTSGVVCGLVVARALSGVVADLASWRAVYLTAAVTTLLLAAVLLRQLPAAGRDPRGPTFTAVLRSLPALYVTMPALARAPCSRCSRSPRSASRGARLRCT